MFDQLRASERWKRAHADTGGVQQWWPKAIISFVTAVVQLVARWKLGEADLTVVDGLIAASVALLVGFVGFPLAAFGWNYLRAPARMRDAKIDEFLRRHEADPVTLFFDPQHPICVQRGIFSLSQWTIIRVGIINATGRRLPRVGVLIHHVEPPHMPDFHMDDKHYLSTGHLHHKLPLKGTGPTIGSPPAVVEFDVDPSPSGTEPTAFVDVIWQSTKQDNQYVPRLLCCAPEVPHRAPRFVSAALLTNTETVLTLRLSSEGAAPQLRLRLSPSDRKELIASVL